MVARFFALEAGLANVVFCYYGGMKMRPYLLPALLLLVPKLALGEDQAMSECGAGWRQVKQEQGIRVCAIAVPGSEILKVKAQVSIAVDMSVVQEILDDVKHRKDWIPYLRESRVLTPWRNHVRLEYSLFSAPWPASDRGFVYRLKLVSSAPGRRVYHMASVSSPLMPVQDGLVRAELIQSTYTLSAIAPASTYVELVFHADPKGWLPNWIINIIQEILPYRILHNLRERAGHSGASRP